MITGIDINAIIEYTLPNDKDNPTIWKIGIIPAAVLGQIGIDAQDKINQVAVLYKILQFGIKGWNNLAGVPYATEIIKIADKEITIVSLDAITRIPINAATELCGKILEVNRLTEQDKKN